MKHSFPRSVQAKRSKIKRAVIHPRLGALSQEEELLATKPEQVNLLRLQSLAGNRAVGALMNNSLRSSTQDSKSLRLASPLAHVQRAVQRQGASSQSFQAELDAILAGILSPPKVPAFEAITSTTGGEYSRTEWEEAMQKTWHRERLSFTAAARKLTGRNAPNRPVSTQGPTIKPQTPYARRWTLNLNATNYKGKGPLTHVSSFLKKGSPFSKAQASESERVITVDDPSAEAMKSQIMDAVLALSAVLPEGQMGELVVYYSGHGTSGSIFGVDWKKVSPMTLQSIAEFGQDWGVHIVYILDSCRAGGFVVLPQAKALQEAEKSFSKLPEAQRKIVSDQALVVRALGKLAFQMNDKTVAASETVRYIKSYTPANRLKMMKSLDEVSKVVVDLKNLMQGGPVLAEGAQDLLKDKKLTPGIVPGQAALEKDIGKLNWALLRAYSGGHSEVNAAFRAMSELIGHWNTAMNTMIEGINSQVGNK